MGRCSDAKERLIATAAKLFFERGYTAVGVAEICDEAGLKKGSFYHFFETKNDLVLQAIDCYAQTYRDLIERALQPDRTAREQLVAVLHGVCGLMERRAECEGRMHGCPIGNLALELAHRDEAIRRKLDDVFASWRAAFETVLRRGLERGEFGPLDPVRTAETIVALVQGATLLAKTANDATVVARVVDSVVGLVPSPAVHSATPA